MQDGSHGGLLGGHRDSHSSSVRRPFDSGCYGNELCFHNITNFAGCAFGNLLTSGTMPCSLLKPHSQDTSWHTVPENRLFFYHWVRWKEEIVVGELGNTWVLVEVTLTLNMQETSWAEKVTRRKDAP